MNIGDQKYNGLVLSLNRRSANGITAGANYTISKCTGLPTQGGGTPNVNSGYSNPDDPDFDRGPCDSDRRHNFNLTASAQTPQFQGGATRWFLSDWRLSHLPVTRALLLGHHRHGPARTNISNQRVDVTGDPYGDGSINNYLNPASFVGRPLYAERSGATRSMARDS
jgi:hypothetical protein